MQSTAAPAVSEPAQEQTPAAPVRRVLLVGNPRARSGEETESLTAPLEALGFDVTMEMPDSIEKLHELIRRVGAEVDRIVIAGGDGSIAAALPALLDVTTPIAVIPLGTANDLARNLGLPATREEQLELVAKGAVRSIDLGRVNGRPFLNAASIGLGATVASLHQGDAKRWFGVLNYVRVLFLAWRRVRPFTVDITCDGVKHRGRFVHVAVLNGRYHGGGLEPRPTGAIDDGLFDLYALRDGPAFRLMQLLAVLRIKGIASDAVFCLTGRHITIQTRRPHRVNVDGELGIDTPLDLEILPNALSVVAPAEPDEAAGLSRPDPSA